jgi:RNA polymerase sigma-70 factor (ECF subfamily)
MSGRYWYPLYAFARRQGLSPEDAQDATQGFFESLFSGEGLKNVRQDQGRLRSYLLGAMKHYLSRLRDRDRAQKRGGGQLALSIDEELAEQRYQNEPSHDVTPETLFDRGWAMEVIKQAMACLEAEYLGKGKGAQFETLHPHLTGESERGDYREAAGSLGESEANVRVIVMRMRKGFRELLRQLICETVSSSEEIEDELGQLMAALA